MICEQQECCARRATIADTKMYDLSANYERPSHYLRNHWPVILVAVAATSAQFLVGNGPPPLRYDREMILQGEIWRLLTGHIIHLSWPHLAMNLLALFLLLLLCWRCMTARDWIIAFMTCALGTGIGLMVLSPHLSWYVGLSGVLHGILVIAIMRAFSKRSLIRNLFLCAVAAKLVWEQLAGPMPGSQSFAGGPVVVDAHLYGAVSALFVLPFYRRGRGDGES